MPSTSARCAASRSRGVAKDHAVSVQGMQVSLLSLVPCHVAPHGPVVSPTLSVILGATGGVGSRRRSARPSLRCSRPEAHTAVVGRDGVSGDCRGAGLRRARCRRGRVRPHPHAVRPDGRADPGGQCRKRRDAVREAGGRLAPPGAGRPALPHGPQRRWGGRANQGNVPLAGAEFASRHVLAPPSEGEILALFARIELR